MNTDLYRLQNEIKMLKEAGKLYREDNKMLRLEIEELKDKLLYITQLYMNLLKHK